MTTPDARPPLKLFRELNRRFEDTLPSVLRGKVILYASAHWRTWLLAPLVNATDEDRRAITDLAEKFAKMVPAPWNAGVQPSEVDGQAGLRVVMMSAVEATIFRWAAHIGPQLAEALEQAHRVSGSN